MERVDQNNSIFTYCQGDISAGILRTVSYPKAHPGPYQICNKDLFARKTNSFKLKLSTIISKSSIVDVWRGAEDISDPKFTTPE